MSYTNKIINYATLRDLYRDPNDTLRMTTDFIPILDQSTAMWVTVDLELYSLNDFDEVSGNLELSASLDISWTDNIVQSVYNDWTLSNSDIFIVENSTSPTANTLMVSHTQIWTPKLVLRNSIDSFSSIGNEAYMCRYDVSTGRVRWQPRLLIKSACSPDVTYYPFDRQSCSFSFVSWGFKSSEIMLASRLPMWDTSSYEDNGLWDFVSTWTGSQIEGDQSVLKMTFTIQRQPLYFAFNIILPVLLLCILNGLVFLLPAESGERVGFSVTCFLSFVVLLNMIMDILPRSSSPMSYLCYYLVVMMIFSGAETALVVLQMRLFHKPDSDVVPGFLRAVLSRCMCRCCSRKRNESGKHKSHVNKTSITPMETVVSTQSRSSEGHVPLPSGSNVAGSTNVKENAILPPILDKTHDRNGDYRIGTTHGSRDECSTDSPDDHDQDCKMATVTWKEVAKLLDIIFFVTFLGVEVFFSITFLLPLAYSARNELIEY